MIRTLVIYQPYATLMGHGKLETRWVKHGRKPPFPRGKLKPVITKPNSAFKTLLSPNQIITWTAQRI